MFEQVLGRMEWIRVRVSSEKKRVRRWRRRENGEKKEKEEKNERTGLLSFYIDAWTGSVQTRSSSLHSQPSDLGFRASGSIQRLWGVLEIRIHPVAWVWASWPWALGSLHFFLNLLLCTPSFLLFEPLCALIFLQNSKKLPCVS